MLTDFQNFFIVGFSNKVAASFCYIAYHTLSVSLHYLVKLKYWKNFRAQELSAANRSARLVHLKMLKNARKVTWILLGLLTRIRSSYASQKNPQDNRIYAPAASRKKTGCAGASAADMFDFQQVTDGDRGRVQVRRKRIWYWSILEWRSMAHTTGRKLITLMNWSSVCSESGVAWSNAWSTTQ